MLRPRRREGLLQVRTCPIAATTRLSSRSGNSTGVRPLPNTNEMNVGPSRVEQPRRQACSPGRFNVASHLSACASPAWWRTGGPARTASRTRRRQRRLRRLGPLGPAVHVANHRDEAPDGGASASRGTAPALSVGWRRSKVSRVGVAMWRARMTSARTALHRDAQYTSGANTQPAPKECVQMRRGWDLRCPAKDPSRDKNAHPTRAGERVSVDLSLVSFRLAILVSCSRCPPNKSSKCLWTNSRSALSPT